MVKGSTPPRLKESQIKAIATNQSFERGKDYFNNGVIENPTCQGHHLWSECYGTDLYYPHVVLGTKGIESSSCTCPYDWDGICKHQVALLLTYIHERDRFRDIPPIPKLLAQHQRKDLLSLIEKMVQSYPDLVDIIDTPQTSKGNTQPNLDRLRRQAKMIFQGDRMRPMAQHLAALIEEADSLTQNDDWVGAGDIYHCLLNVANEHYDYEVLEVDYDGEVGCKIQDMAQGLVDSLENADFLDRDHRQQWLKCLFNAFIKDIDLGGMDYGYPARDAIIEQASEDDWIWIEQEIREQISQLSQKSYSDWGKQHLVEFLAQRSTEQGHSADELILELGTLEQQAYLYLAQKNFEKAVAIAKQDFPSKPGLVSQFADNLIEANQPNLALDFVQFCRQSSPNHYKHDEWLAKFYREHGLVEDYIAVASEQLQSYFSTTTYRELQAKAEPLGQWEPLRQTLLTTYQRKQQNEWLLEIAMLEQDWDQAFVYFNDLRLWSKTRYQLKLAQTAKGDRPELALSLYTDLIAELISRRGRDNYQEAARLLKEVRSLFRQMKQTSKFKNYLDNLRSSHSNLPAFQDELTKAKL